MAGRRLLPELTSRPHAEASRSLSTGGQGGISPGRKEQRDEALHVGKDRKLHTNTLPSHVPLRGGGFYGYIKGCVCIGNKIFL